MVGYDYNLNSLLSVKFDTIGFPLMDLMIDYMDCFVAVSVALSHYYY